MVSAQGGDSSCLEDTGKLPLSPCGLTVTAAESGYIAALDAEACGLAAMELGAGRESKEDEIDYGAGIELLANKGSKVEQGQPIAKLYAGEAGRCERAKERFLSALSIEKEEPEARPLIIERIGI